MKKLTYITLALICTAIFTTCKKYPEGGTIKKGPKNIIGEWRLILYEVDGIDSTSLINYNNTDDYKHVDVTTACSDCEIHMRITGGITYEFYFSDDNISIKGKADAYYGAKTCFTFCLKEYFVPEGDSSEWQILKLDSKEMHLQMQGLHNYNLKFNKTSDG